MAAVTSPAYTRARSPSWSPQSRRQLPHSEVGCRETREFLCVAARIHVESVGERRQAHALKRLLGVSSLLLLSPLSASPLSQRANATATQKHTALLEHNMRMIELEHILVKLVAVVHEEQVDAQLCQMRSARQCTRAASHMRTTQPQLRAGPHTLTLRLTRVARPREEVSLTCTNVGAKFAGLWARYHCTPRRPAALYCTCGACAFW
eukprot:5187046-Prymnesium_polylepis.1